MKIILIITGVVFVFLTNTCQLVRAQVLQGTNLRDDIYDREHVPVRKPVPYYHLREADVMWKKKIWRMIDLKEKINFPLYYPVDPVDNRMSLADLIINGVQYENLEVYDPGDDEFKVPMTFKQLKEVSFRATSDTQQVEDVTTGELKNEVVEREILSEEVMKIMLKEIWYFNRQRSILNVRTVGICLIREFFREGETDKDYSNITMEQVCWVYFPALRPLLANHEVFNEFNDAERKTFDDIFFKRKFSSYIYQETNVYNNRYIGNYKQGIDVMLESEKIKDFMFKLEHDLWEY